MSGVERQRVATWVLTRCAADYEREAFIGDLIEQYDERGGWWFWRQVLSAVRAHFVRLAIHATETRVQATEFIGDLIMWIALGMCALIQLPIYADLLISWTPLIRSQQSIGVISALLAGGLIGAATTAHQIRTKAARTT